MARIRHLLAWLPLLALGFSVAIPAPAVAAQETARPVTSFDAYGVRQTDAFAFSAAAGHLTVRMAVHADEQFQVMVAGSDEVGLIMNEVLRSQQPEASVALPAAGDYYLMIAPLTATGPVPDRRVEVTGTDLSMPGEGAPPILLREVGLYETFNDPFDLQVGIKPPAQAANLRILLNDNVLHENVLGAGGEANQVTIDPATLEDGIHRLLAVAQSAGSLNEGLALRTFFVDRADSFADVPAGHWARKPVEFMSHQGIVNGRGGGLFDPGAPVTRAEFAKMIALALQLEERPGGTDFADVPAGHWARPHVQALAAAGLLRGEEEGGKSYFRPDRTITRAEAATIIGRAMGIAVADAREEDLAPGQPRLTDLDQVPDWARPSVLILRSIGWINGFPDGSFGPERPLHRDQSAQILSKFLGL